MGYIKGWIYLALWYASILAGYSLLFCPLLPVLFLSNRLYRKCSDIIFTLWQMYPSALVEFWCGCDVQVLGDAIRSDESSLLIMNHRTRTDWNFLWPALYHCTDGPKRYQYPTKFILKHIIRNVPGAGWVMQLAFFIFIRRFWSVDRIKLKNAIDYFKNLDYKYSILVFPEGTDFTPSTKICSDKYAEKHDLQKYDYLLHPRTTGFTFITQQLLSNGTLDALYDITLVYPDNIPQTEKILFNGNFPKQVKLHFTRYPSAVLPRSEEELKQFLEKLWQEKERVLREFHSTGHFLHGEILKKSSKLDLYAALIFWTLLPYLAIYILYTVWFFKYIVFIHMAFQLYINLIFDGLQEFEISLFNLKTKICGMFFKCSRKA